MEGNRFDKLTRLLAASPSRRTLFSGMAAAVVAALRLRHTAAVICGEGFIACGNICCSSSQSCCQGSTLTSCCNPSDPGTSVCCPEGHCCGAGTDCCLAGGGCCGTHAFCCRAGTTTTCCLRTSVCTADGCRPECPANQVRCGNACCPEGHECDAATNSCRERCRPDQTQCGETCCDGPCDATGQDCCPAGRRCDNRCCGDSQFCLEIAPGFDVCCDEDRTCGAQCCSEMETCTGRGTSDVRCCASDHVCADASGLPRLCCNPAAGLECCNGACCDLNLNDVCAGGECCSLLRACAGDTVCCPADHQCIGDLECCPEGVGRICDDVCCPPGEECKNGKCKKARK